jgi:hypothetical protein
LFQRKRKCHALRPTPDPNHVDCLPGTCKSCYRKCTEELRDDEEMFCRDCIHAYINHPSPSVRLAFLHQSLDDGWATREIIAEMTRDPNASVSITAANALREYVPASIQRQLR